MTSTYDTFARLCIYSSTEPTKELNKRKWAEQEIRFAMLSNKPAEAAYEVMRAKDPETPEWRKLSTDQIQAWADVIRAAIEVVAKEVGR